MLQPWLILASASPRRQELLREAGYRFEIHPADIDESIRPAGLSPAQVALYLAEKKARAVAGSFSDRVVLAADTIVVLEGRIFGKPADRGDARQMLSRLSGTVHSVVTGVAVVRLSRKYFCSQLVESSVEMRPLSAGEIEAYLDTNNWQGKAGSYGIQDQDPFVTRITGSLSNIVGLPMEEARSMLTAAGVRSSGTAAPTVS
jgi:septum formation protein